MSFVERFIIQCPGLFRSEGPFNLSEVPLYFKSDSAGIHAHHTVTDMTVGI